MGLFDRVRVKYPLPVATHNAMCFQCKDTDAQYMENYTIEEDGRLIHHTVEYYDVPKAERPFPNAPEGSLQSMAGCIGIRPMGDVEEYAHGALYLTCEDDAGTDYVALYQRGKLLEIAAAT